MVLDFPNSPTVGQIFSDAGAAWMWDGSKWGPRGGSDPRGQLTLITRQDVGPAVATVNFTSGIDATYDEYELHFFGARVSADVALGLQISQDGGATWKTGAADYLYEAAYLNYTSTSSQFIGSGSGGSAFIFITSTNTNTASGANAQGKVCFAQPAAVSSFKQFIFDSRGIHPTQGSVSWRGGGHYVGTGSGNAFNGLRIGLGAAGNITAGTFILYGVKK